VSWDKKAEFLKVSKRACTHVLLRSEAFARTMSQLSARDRWNFIAQDEANRQFVTDAHNPLEKPEARVRVAQYLGVISGIADSPEANRGVHINLTFGDSNTSLADLQSRLAGDEHSPAKTIEASIIPQKGASYRPARSGDPLPEGVRLHQDTQSRRLRDGDTLLPEAVPRPQVGQAAGIQAFGEGARETAKRKPELADSAKYEQDESLPDLFRS
jgi:hypothetical protein